MTRYCIATATGRIGSFDSATEAAIAGAMLYGNTTKWEWVTVNTPAQRDAVRAELERRR